MGSKIKAHRFFRQQAISFGTVSVLCFRYQCGRSVAAFAA